MHRKLVREVFDAVGAIFPITRLYTAFIPLYPTGMHCFTMGSKKYDPLTWESNRKQTFETKYYNEGIQKSAFVLPNFVKELLYGEKDVWSVKKGAVTKQPLNLNKLLVDFR